MKQNFKALEFIYQDTQIHFLLSNDDNVMVNATEMAKVFGKETRVFLKTDHAKSFIKVAEQAPNGARSDLKIIDNRGHMGIYFHRILAIKFAAWLDPNFEVWIYSTVDKILFGHYKQHWDAHIKQENAKQRMEASKRKLLTNATQEDVIAYFEAELEFNTAKSEKTKAINSQYKLFDTL